MYKIFNNNIMGKIDGKLYFDPIGIHGVLHTYRVLRLILWLGTLEKLTENEMSILFYSGLYHDIGRTNNLVDDSHGVKSYEKIINKGLLNNIKDLESEDIEIMKFTIEQHAIKDEIGKKNIINYNITDVSKTFKLYEIFKDADGLDRVRIGDLNIKYLRRKYSKVLVEDAKRLYKEFPNRSHQEIYKYARQLLINKEITKERSGEINYNYLNASLLPKVNNCNMIYNSEIENSKCNNEYFQSIIDVVNNNIDRPINNLKDHILWLKQYIVPTGIIDIQIKDNSIKINHRNNDDEFFIYPVEKKNYHLFHGTSISNVDKIIKDGYIKTTKKYKYEFIDKINVAYNKIFLSNSTKYASLYGTSGGSSNMFSAFVDNNNKLNEYSVIFQIDTSKYDIYHYYTHALDCEEYFVWDSISIYDIEKVYLMRYCEIVKEFKLN